MDEFAIIEAYFASRVRGRADVRLGIGDDGAVVSPGKDSELVIVTDTIVEGTHFPTGTAARALGHRCLAVNLSDLAAMGAEPLWCTLALSLPSADADWLEEFAGGFFELARRWDIALVGGDTVRGPLAVTVTAHGRVEPGRQVQRSGAQPGQGIYLTGYPGEAAAGLRLLQDAGAATDPVSARLTRRFLFPEPRVGQGRRLARFASSMIDVSDGLHTDLEKLMHASGLGADLDADRIPLSAALCEYAGESEALDLALTGGDDYELCFTAAKADEHGLADLALPDCPLTRIGETSLEPGVRWTRASLSIEVPESSFRHF